jgi:hypothetical protein
MQDIILCVSGFIIGWYLADGVGRLVRMLWTHYHR